MSYAEPSQTFQVQPFAADARVDERASFISQTYLHLACAVSLFVGFEIAMIKLGGAELLFGMLGQTRYGMLLLLGGFIIVSMVADRWARSAVSLPKQYAGLLLYVAAEAVIFAPLLYFATMMQEAGRIPSNTIALAAVITLGMFAALTAFVFVTRKDFSFMRGILFVGGIAAFLFIIAGMIFGLELGIFFSIAMIALACGYILYDTSNVLHHYRVGQHVAASLALFASVALLFYYVLRLVMALTSRD
jgi:FtsH-binding integral membrane protein